MKESARTAPESDRLPRSLHPSRVVIEAVLPEIDGGRYPIKRCPGETVEVTAAVFADGHDRIAAVLRWRGESDRGWRETPMTPGPNDTWSATFPVERLEPYRYTVVAWIDAFATWRSQMAKRVDAGRVEPVDLRVGAALVAEAAARASGDDAALLAAWARRLEAGAGDAAPLDPGLAAAAGRHPDRSMEAVYEHELPVLVDRPLARAGAWYEFFPRSAGSAPGKHGTFKDCEARLPEVAAMGFDVVYLPPIHPIGRTHRKGKNNAPESGADDVGSPWAIGAAEGGHTAVHPELGTLEDFRRLLARAREHGLEIALDLAFQCSPDHPWVTEHPAWFRRRPDGSVQCAENPPKKYEDIYPILFENEDWRALWEELRRVTFFWMEQGVRIFRVDNPHTKPLPFWEWLIGEARREHPDVIFLAEAFTRPKVMYQLAKVGFDQSYTYFAWRNTKADLIAYMTELTRTEVREYFRPNLWPNTPDILTEYLQFGGRPAFMARAALAATLGASWGIYGPAFELGENRPRSPGSEEYLDSEKYQIRAWDRTRPDSLADYVARLNRIRRENPALADGRSLRFHPVDNDQILAFTKAAPDRSNVVLVVVNLDPHHVHSGWLDLPLDELGLGGERPYQVHDLITDAHYLWSGSRNFVQLDPASSPAHVFRLRRKVRTERDFDYYL